MRAMGFRTCSLNVDNVEFVRIFNERNTLKHQRDELLSALERAVQSIIMFRNEQTLHRLLKLRTNVSYMEMHNAMDEARAAIARAKGGAA